MKLDCPQPACAGVRLRPSWATRLGAGLLGALFIFCSSPVAMASGQAQNPVSADWARGHDDGRGHGRGGHGDHDQRGQVLVLGDVAASAWEDGRTVGVQFELVNSAREPLKDVCVKSITIAGGWYQGPVQLPIAAGKVQAEDSLLVNAIFRLAPINGSPHAFTLEGTYAKRGTTQRFKLQGVINPSTREPGPFALVNGVAMKKIPRKQYFPPRRPPPADEENENNEVTPILIPPGADRELFDPTGEVTGETDIGSASGIVRSSASATASVRGKARSNVRNVSAGLVEIVSNTVVAPTPGMPPDPNAAASAPNGVVLYTYNLVRDSAIAFSTDGGATFTNIDLFDPEPGNAAARPTFFPQSDAGLCCDQSVVYVPERNLFVWLIQYYPTRNADREVTAPNRLRIAWATPQEIAADFYNAWTYTDLTAGGLGVPSNEWLDYPDLAWSNAFLYVGVNHGRTTGRGYPGRRIVARMRLDDMVNPAATTVRYNRTELRDSSGLKWCRFVQGAPGRMVVGSVYDESRLRVYTLLDEASAVVTSTVPISKISTNYSALAPDGRDWVKAAIPGAVNSGAYRRVNAENAQGFRDEYLFAFAAGINPRLGRPYPYVRIETVAPPNPESTSYEAVDEYDVWNRNYAFALAALGSDGDEISFNLVVGGGTAGFPHNSVGYMFDFATFKVTSSTATQSVLGDRTRVGDYFSNRLVPGGRRLFGAAVYDVLLNPLPPGVPFGTCELFGCTARVRYVLYGRPQVIP